MAHPNDDEVFDLGDVALQRGATLRDAKLAYKTYGELDEDRSNAIVYPTWYSGRHWDNEWLIGAGMALDPATYFIIVPNMLGNGLSSSPSNTPLPYDRARFPYVTVYDNVAVQHRLVTERFGIERLVLVTRWSMGAGQTYQWRSVIPTWSSAPARSGARQHRVPRGRQGSADRRRRLAARLLRAAAGQQAQWHSVEPESVNVLPVSGTNRQS